MSDLEIIFKECTSILNKIDQEYWLTNGTLLGIVRESKLIPWDLEIDIGVLKDNFSKEKAKTSFVSKGFDLYDEGVNSNHITFIKRKIRVDINLYVLKNDKYETIWRIPKYSLSEKIINKFISFANYFLKTEINKLKASKFLKEGYSIPLNYLMPLKKISFLKTEVMIPYYSEKLMEWTYGLDWKIPKKDYNWRIEGANNSYET